MQYPGPPQSSYQMVNDQQFPGPHGRNAPRYAPPGARRSRHPCLKCYCWCSCVTFVLLLLFAAGCAAAFAIINPALPKYVVSDLTSNTFNFSEDDFKLKAHFVITLVADNPNKYISIIYKKDSVVELLFRENRFNFTKISTGTFPEFKQPTSNITSMKIDLKGDLLKRDFNSPDEFKKKVKTNKIPLVVAVKTKANLIITGNHIDHLVLLGVNCSMDVNTLEAGKAIKMTDMIYESVTLNYKLKDE